MCRTTTASRTPAGQMFQRPSSSIRLGNRPAKCPRCGGRKWWKKWEHVQCAKCHRRYVEKAGLHKIQVSNPALADRLEKLRGIPLTKRILRLAGGGNRWERHFRPSEFFPGIAAKLDNRLISLGRNTDVGLCDAIAAVDRCDQAEFLDLYLIDPDDARHWSALPRWKRPIRKGDEQDRLIWKVFMMQWLAMKMLASPDRLAWSIASQGNRLQALAGVLASIRDVHRLSSVLSAYGGLLAAGVDPEGQEVPPWKESPTTGYPGRSKRSRDRE